MRLTLASIGTLFLSLGVYLFATTSKDNHTMAEQDMNQNPTVLIKTTLGNIELELFPDKAPNTVKNFLQYVKSGHYDNTIFHRVIDGFMIQGGGFTADLKQKPTEKAIKNEADNGLSNKRGTVAMARTQVVDSATAQFFINVSDNGFLDYRGNSPQEFGYCVFAEVTQGMDVVDKIKLVETGSQGPYKDLPTKPITILSAKVIAE